ncbi:MAG: hypothetical protein WCY41_03535 [Candidatus Micrarchaeia archaeon]
MEKIRLKLTKAEEDFVNSRIRSGGAETPGEVIRQSILWLKWSDEHEDWCQYKREAAGRPNPCISIKSRIGRKA